MEDLKEYQKLAINVGREQFKNELIELLQETKAVGKDTIRLDNLANKVNQM